MIDLAPIAATLLADFVTIRIPWCERLWTNPVPELPLEAHYRLSAMTMRGERLVADCHRHHLRQLLLEDGHRAFFDRIEGGGPDGWRLHFFSLDPVVTVLHAAGVGAVGPGETVHFNAKEFVVMRLRQLERSARLDKPNDWWWWLD